MAAFGIERHRRRRRAAIPVAKLLQRETVGDVVALAVFAEVAANVHLTVITIGRRLLKHGEDAGVDAR
jgi:hypothetical protein